MAISHTLGLYIPFKFNRPLTKEEKQSRFFQDKLKKGSGEAAVLDLDTVTDEFILPGGYGQGLSSQRSCCWSDDVYGFVYFRYVWMVVMNCPIFL